MARQFWNIRGAVVEIFSPAAPVCVWKKGAYEGKLPTVRRGQIETHGGRAGLFNVFNISNISIGHSNTQCACVLV